MCPRGVPRLASEETMMREYLIDAAGVLLLFMGGVVLGHSFTPAKPCACKCCVYHKCVGDKCGACPK